MRTILKFIGLIDRQEIVHGVELHQGLNLITGKSSTGKSSLIEIFDFCMGSSEDTIPHGIIEENAATFFLWINIYNVDYLFARDADSKGFYIVHNVEINNVWELSSSIFDQCDLQKIEYKIQLGQLFGIETENTAETIEQLNDKRKNAGRPSVRNMMPFILQHQNLIANKQALFYRFDQKEKREATIDQFKVFAGFVNTRYYSLSVEVSMLLEKIEKLKKQLSKSEEDIEVTYNKLLEDIDFYRQITGNNILEGLTLEKFKANPSHFKEIIDKTDLFEIKINTDNSLQLQKYQELEKEENRLMAELRQNQLDLKDVINSIDYIKTYKDSLVQIPRPAGIKINYSICPFCHQNTPAIFNEANSLRKALLCLNEELKGIPSIIRPLEEERLKLDEKVKDITNSLNEIDIKKAEMTDIITELKKNYSLNKQAYKTIYRISSRIEIAVNEALEKLERRLDALTENLYDKQQLLKEYDLRKKETLAERAIRQAMARYRELIPFEHALNDYCLVFDLQKFELYFQKGEDKYADKKRLRSIGSGANWLNAHLCLFLALADFFNEQKASTVPSLLFLDQPSQVYFPVIKDNDSRFIKDDKNDEDLAAVNKVFSLLYKFCKEHNNDIQIIVTDHADDLTIEGLDNFSDIVSARWRNEGEGLINYSKNN